MKFKSEIRERIVQHTNGGVTHDVTEPYEVRTPKLPADWDQRAIAAAVAVVMILTGIAVAWSTVSIGSLLGGGIGYLAAGVFDAAWIVNVLLEYLSRFDPTKRKFNKRLGWGLLAATMGAIFWHGLLSGSVPLGVVGAAVSLFAKVLWMGIMRFINRDLSTRDQQWVAAEISHANATLAISGVRRMVARAENRAALELLAAERTRNEVAQWLGTAPDAAPVLESTTATAPAVSAPSDAPAELVSETTDDTTAARRHDATKPGLPLFQAPAVRADDNGYPTAEPYAQATAPSNVRTLRPEVRDDDDTDNDTDDDTEPQRAAERVPEQRPASIAKEVRRMVADGLTDADHIVRSLAGRFGRDADDPKFGQTVKRYVREAKNTGETDVQGQGLYL